MSSAKLDGTGQRWVSCLFSFNYDIQSWSGQNNTNADALSRISWRLFRFYRLVESKSRLLSRGLKSAEVLQIKCRDTALLDQPNANQFKEIGHLYGDVGTDVLPAMTTQFV